MSELQIFPQEYEALIFATSHKELAPLAMALLGLSEERIDFIDPEKPSDQVEFQPEPASENPFEAVLFKLRRVLEHLKPEKQEKNLAFYASDVAFAANGQHFLKPSRNGEIQDLGKVHQEIFSRYNQPFLASWDVVFGVADKQGITMGDIKIEADYPALTMTEVVTNFSENMNPGLDMVGIGIDKRLEFRLYLENDTEPFLINDSDGYYLLYQFIVQKIPTAEMIHNLLRQEVRQKPDAYGLFAQGFLSIQTFKLTDSPLMS